MIADDITNTTVGREIVYVTNTNTWRDTPHETSLCDYSKYRHPWKAAQPIDLEDQN